MRKPKYVNRKWIGSSTSGDYILAKVDSGQASLLLHTGAPWGCQDTIELTYQTDDKSSVRELRSLVGVITDFLARVESEANGG